MVDSDTIGLAVIAGGGYLLVNELTGFFKSTPEWVKEDAKEINQAIKDERNSDLPSSEYRKHIIEAKSKYRRHYSECADSGDPSVEELEQDIESKDLTLEEESWAWKMAADAMVNKCRQELGGVDLPDKKEIAIGLILAAMWVERQRLANFAKWAKEWMENNDPPNNGGGGGSGTPDQTRDLGSNKALQALNSSSSQPVLTGAVADATSPEPVIYEPPENPTGEPTTSGNVGDALDVAPDWAVEAVTTALDADTDAGIEWSMAAVDAIAGATSKSVTWLVNNPGKTAAIIIVALAVAAASASTFGFGTPVATSAGAAILGAIGVSISVSQLEGIDIGRYVEIQ